VSDAHVAKAAPICLRLAAQAILCEFARIEPIVEKPTAASTTTIAMTTNSSVSVNPKSQGRLGSELTMETPLLKVKRVCDVDEFIDCDFILTASAF
jgi:hypothetical protein